jgi:hypothetical protein
MLDSIIVPVAAAATKKYIYHKLFQQAAQKRSTCLSGLFHIPPEPFLPFPSHCQNEMTVLGFKKATGGAAG